MSVSLISAEVAQHSLHDANEDLAQRLNIGSIAVIGASEDQSKFGGRLFKNLLHHGFSGTTYPINTSRTSLFGIPAYPSLQSLPQTPDAFVLALPAHLVKEQVLIAANMGIKLGIIISSGFSDAGEAGKQLEQELVHIAQQHNMRLIGPNCLGIISPAKGIVLCSSPILDRADLPQRPIGLVSQSGALMTAAFDKAWYIGSGLVHGFSVGNQADLEVCDFIDFMVNDPATRVICAYIEGIKNPQRFLHSARQAREAGKPLLIVKAGKSEAGQQAAFSHTASIAGDAAVFAAVCQEQGALILDDINTLLSVANYLATQPHIPLKKVAIVTPSGGGGALAADALADANLPLASLDAKAKKILHDFYPADQIKNPLDFGTRLGNDERASAQASALAVQQAHEVDATLCVTAMAPVTWQLQLVEALAEQAKAHQKPMIVAIDAGHTSDPVRQRLTELRIPYTNSTTDAVNTLAQVRKWQNLALSAAGTRPPACPTTPYLFTAGQYDEHQTKAILSQYGIANNAGILTNSAPEACSVAEQLGYPVVLKVVSADVVHKSDAGGVIIRLQNAQEVHNAYHTILANIARHQPDARIEGILVQSMLEGHVEIIVGGRNDPEFGPIILFGAGGVLVELLNDQYLATAPLTPEAVLQGLQSLSIWKVLAGYRGKSCDLKALVDMIVRLSWMMHDLRAHSFEIDLNPILVSADHATAVDARLLIQ